MCLRYVALNFFNYDIYVLFMIICALTFVYECKLRVDLKCADELIDKKKNQYIKLSEKKELNY